MFKFQYQNWKKRKNGKKSSGLRNGTIRGLQIGTGFRYYKSGQEGLQKDTALEISNWLNKITNRGNKNFILGQILQIYT